MDAVIEGYHAIGNILFQSVAGERAFAALSGNHGGETAIFEPPKKTAYFRAQHALIGKTGKHRFQGVGHDALGADGIDGVLEAYEQSFEIVLAGFLNLAGFDVHIIEGKFFAAHQSAEVESQGLHVAAHLVGGFFKSHQHAGFVEFRGAANKEFHSKHGFSATRAAANDGGSSCRKAATSELIKAGDAGGNFFQLRKSTRGIREASSFCCAAMRSDFRPHENKFHGDGNISNQKSFLLSTETAVIEIVSNTNVQRKPRRVWINRRRRASSVTPSLDCKRSFGNR